MMKDYDYAESEDSYEIALEWIKNREPEKAIACLHRCIELNPNFIYAYVTLADTLAMTRDYSQAIKILKKASKLDPSFHRLNFLMAKYAFSDGDYPTALKYINMAIEKAATPLYTKSKKVIIRATRSMRRKR